MSRRLSPLSFVRGTYYYVLAFAVLICLPLIEIPRRVARLVWSKLGRPTLEWVKRSWRTEVRGLKDEKENDGQKKVKYREEEDEATSPLRTPLPIIHRSVTTSNGNSRLHYRLFNPHGRKLLVFVGGLNEFAFDAFIRMAQLHAAKSTSASDKDTTKKSKKRNNASTKDDRMIRFLSEYTFLTWSYRGLSATSSPSTHPSVASHVADLMSILKYEGRRHIDLLVGHEYGAAIGMELVSSVPMLVSRMVTINGGYGSVFNYMFQPLFPIPTIGAAINWSVEFLLMHEQIASWTLLLARPFVWMYARSYSALFTPDSLVAADNGDGNLANLHRALMENEFMLNDLFRTRDPTHIRNVLQFLLELHAHTCWHVLPRIDVPTLVVSGLIDPSIPAYLSFDLSRRLPYAKRVIAKWSGHATLVVQHSFVMQHIEELVERGHQVKEYTGSPVLEFERNAKARLVNELQHRLQQRRLAADATGSTSSAAVGDAFQRAAHLSATLTGHREGIPYERSVARRGTSAAEESDMLAYVDDHTNLTLDPTVGTEGGGYTLAPEDIPTEEEMEAFNAARTAAATATTVGAVTMSADVGEQHQPGIGVDLSSSASSSASPSSSSSIAPAPNTPARSAAASSVQRPRIGLLTCSGRENRKGDDLALVAQLRARGYDAELVTWDAMETTQKQGVEGQESTSAAAASSPWSRYSALLCRSVWGYYLTPSKWLSTISTIESLNIPLCNAAKVIRWNSSKTYLRSMQRQYKNEQPKGFHFIPTLWLDQSMLTNESTLESTLLLQEWSSSSSVTLASNAGSILKPVIGAGSFGAQRLPQVGNLAFKKSMAQAREMKLEAPQLEDDASHSDKFGDAKNPTWMIQPFQTQVQSDGEYSLFFLNISAERAQRCPVLTAAERATKMDSTLLGHDDTTPTVQSNPSDPLSSFHLIHACKKLPSRGSAIIQPSSQGGSVQRIAVTKTMEASARAILASIPFLQNERAKEQPITFVRIDGLRTPIPSSSTASGGAFELSDELTLMEVELIEPDFYSFLTPGFEILDLEATLSFLQRHNVLPPGGLGSTTPSASRTSTPFGKGILRKTGYGESPLSTPATIDAQRARVEQLVEHFQQHVTPIKDTASTVATSSRTSTPTRQVHHDAEHEEKQQVEGHGHVADNTVKAEIEDVPDNTSGTAAGSAADNDTPAETSGDVTNDHEDVTVTLDASSTNDNGSNNHSNSNKQSSKARRKKAKAKAQSNKAHEEPGATAAH